MALKSYTQRGLQNMYSLGLAGNTHPISEEPGALYIPTSGGDSDAIHTFFQLGRLSVTSLLTIFLLRFRNSISTSSSPDT